MPNVESRHINCCSMPPGWSITPPPTDTAYEHSVPLRQSPCPCGRRLWPPPARQSATPIPTTYTSGCYWSTSPTGHIATWPGTSSPRPDWRTPPSTFPIIRDGWDSRQAASVPAWATWPDGAPCCSPPGRCCRRPVWTCSPPSGITTWPWVRGPSAPVGRTSSPGHATTPPSATRPRWER